MKRIIAAVVCLIGFSFAGFAQKSSPRVPRKPVKSTLTDAEKETRFVRDLMKKMTLTEKIGQLSQYVGGELLTGPKSGAVSDSLFVRGMVGSILNVGGVDNLRKLQQKNMESSRLKIPILFAFDVIHGYKTIFPTPLAESCSWDLALMYETAKAAAIEASASGIHWTFAPMVDVARDPRWGRIVEGAGEDTYLGCKIAEARVRGFQWNLGKPNALFACAKHFVAYGAPQAGRDYAPVDLSLSTLAEVYLPPFKACIDAGVHTFMSAFNSINGVPATSNRWLLTDLLRKEWKFKGFVVSDWNAVQELKAHGVAETDEDAAMAAFNAGVDMNMTDGLYNRCLEKLVRENRIDMNEIDASVERILRAKYALGLFEDPYRFLDNQRESREVRSASAMALARKAAASSMVLLKNANALLPLSKQTKRIALVGPLANNRAEVMGSWKARGEDKDVVTVLEGIKNKLGSGTEVNYIQGCDFLDPSTSEFSAALEAAKQSDVVIAVVGEKALMSGESRSRAVLRLPGKQEALLDTLRKAGKPLVVVLMNGRPLCLESVDKQADAMLEAWFPGTQCGNAVADVLFGDIVPAAKLTASFPLTEGQIPNNYNYKRSGRPGDMPYSSTVRHIDVPNRNLYPFGYGLSYTTFSYGKMQCPSAFDEKGFLPVSVDVTNTGNYDGEEIVQLYVADKVASMVRPIKELKGFQKVFIPKGQTKRVEFKLNVKDLGFWNSLMQYVVEPGTFEIMVGTNSEELQKKEAVWDDGKVSEASSVKGRVVVQH
ncbi:MAG: glycoside hydrolase family 3 C-terminal domain-containing protein [Prevotella salivae]|uniref:glycoside hydrolase family 3 N-terminal domain-containing protein n=1 Tax=Segatella salivae TaxID=228604 RepID=UPI001CB50420|nr:glycoside hydrolase family 3 N-terminal domain-containing protein [Segatella salivae]MBF1548406.1 glycoside hydrolase family 3 C-terminal domain-containing protein [Segatella salivae]